MVLAPESPGPATDSTFSFVHAADLHLDTPFKGLHELAPRVAAALREASLDAFDAIVDLALERSASFAVFAGDIYDGAERGLRAQLRFRDGLARLAAAGIPAFVVHGNHDPVTTGWSAIGSFPPGVTVFPHGRVEVVPVVRGGRVLATIQGISYATQHTTENLARGFARPEGPGFHVGLLHCNVQGAADGYDDYAPCTLEDLRRTRLDYLALGHIHQTKVLVEGSGPGDPWVVYPGNSQARSSRPSERGPKGAVVVEVADDRVVRVEHVACDRVRFVELDCEIAGIDDFGALEEELVELGAEALTQCGGRSVVLRVRLVGRGPVHHGLRRVDASRQLLARLREQAGDATPFCWWDDLEDATAPVLDLDALRGRGDFASDLLAQSELLAGDPSALLEAAAALAAAVPRSLRADVDALLADETQLQALVAQATLVALDVLDDGFEESSR